MLLSNWIVHTRFPIQLFNLSGHLKKKKCSSRKVIKKYPSSVSSELQSHFNTVGRNEDLVTYRCTPASSADSSLWRAASAPEQPTRRGRNLAGRQRLLGTTLTGRQYRPAKRLGTASCSSQRPAPCLCKPSLRNNRKRKRFNICRGNVRSKYGWIEYGYQQCRTHEIKVCKYFVFYLFYSKEI